VTCPICRQPILDGQPVTVIAIASAFMIGGLRQKETVHSACVMVQHRMKGATP
jgi:hypothetical protein